MIRRISVTLAAVGLLTVATAAQNAASLASLAALKTTPESTAFKSTSTYEDVVTFMKAAAEASPIVFSTTYGTTTEGRAMPMAVVGTGLKDGSPAAVKATGKLRVHIQGNIHAGEVEGKESAQMLLRDLALHKHDDWLRSIVFLITPIFNADGNEKFSLTNRGRQNGPINGMGTRAQAQNLNINRDFMKLETPEGRAFAKQWNDYDPHVGYDLHTSDGSFHAYHLTYAPPLNPDTPASIMSVMKDEWFPFVTKNIKAKHGWETFYYGNVQGAGGRGGRGRGDAAGGGRDAAPVFVDPVARTWASFEALPRYHNSYVGMRNRFALLSEAYSYLTFEDRIKATNAFLEETLTFAAQNADRLKKICADADKASIAGKTLATRTQLKRGGMVQILMGDVDPVFNPNGGGAMWLRKDVVRPEQMNDMMWFEASKSETAPSTYYVPAAATRALDLLRAHGVRVERVSRAVTGVEQFAITNNTARPVPNNSIDFGQHGVRTLDGSWQAAPTVTVPPGAFSVSVNQPLGLLAFYLLEPTSDDGLTTWNVFDEMLAADAMTYPVLRKG
ncbi:MAG TPA: M14 family zinc carboxypeptidase [Vicinamibacterales bacterium]|nr:M14 family zinc carboxypeptidase [Vicinamibacterales bacterium]